MSLELQISILLLVSMLAFLLGKRCGLPASVFQIIGGVLIGPTVLGILEYSSIVEQFAHLGAIVLLFLIGLEFSPKEVFRLTNYQIAFGGIVIPWISGWAIAHLFSYTDIQAIVIGTALTATSIAVTADILKEMKVLNSSIASKIIGAAVIDDIVALTLMNVIVNIETGSYSVTELFISILAVVFFISSGLLVGTKLILRFLHYIEEKNFFEESKEFIFIFSIVLAMTYCVIAEWFHVSAITGAFVAGTVLESTRERSKKVITEGIEIMRIFFSSIFFIALGIAVNINFSFVSTKEIIFLIIIILVALLSKVIGCGIITYINKEKLSNTLFIGISMVPRGEIATIIALYAISHQIIDQNLYSSIIVMSLLTTLVTPGLLRYLQDKVTFNA